MIVYTIHSRGNVQILSLSGRIDTSNLPPIRRWIEDATASEPAYIVINLEQVNFLDSNALATLVFGLKRSRQVKGNLNLCSLQQPVRILFELTRMDRVFDIYPCEEDAINAFKKIEVVSES
jgi:anti-sigma B factor antagonist